MIFANIVHKVIFLNIKNYLQEDQMDKMDKNRQTDRGTCKVAI